MSAPVREHALNSIQGKLRALQLTDEQRELAIQQAQADLNRMMQEAAAARPDLDADQALLLLLNRQPDPIDAMVRALLGASGGSAMVGAAEAATDAVLGVWGRMWGAIHQCASFLARPQRPNSNARKWVFVVVAFVFVATSGVGTTAYVRGWFEESGPVLTPSANLETNPGAALGNVSQGEPVTESEPPPPSEPETEPESEPEPEPGAEPESEPARFTFQRSYQNQVGEERIRFNVTDESSALAWRVAQELGCIDVRVENPEGEIHQQRDNVCARDFDTWALAGIGSWDLVLEFTLFTGTLEAEVVAV